MVARSTGRRVRAGRKQRSADNPALAVAARAGMTARGVLYGLIGVIALEIAFGGTKQQADKTGALRLVGQNAFGEIVLWLLAIGFAGMALWQAAQAGWGAPGRDGKKASARLAAGAKAVFYAVITFSVLKYAIGLGAPPSSNKESQDLTATVLRHPGGQALVIIVGVAFAAGGIYLAWQAWRKKFAENLDLGSASATTRKTVLRLGQAGGIARGAVFVTAGIFLIIAGADAQPGKAKGVDSALRALARTPLGPWLLAVVAAGLVLYGAYSLCEARWRRV
jgi:uncharacterized protein DUF1206